MKLHKIALLGIIGFLPAFMNAQVKQEVGAYIGGGLSSLNYKNSSTDFSDRVGFSGGFSYQYFITNNWGIKSGLELSYYHSKTDITSIAGSVAAIDSENKNFEYQYSIGGYEEKQKSYILNIPIMASFQTDRPNSTSNFYASAGVKLGLPVSTKYDSKISSIQAQGYYESTNVTYTDLFFSGFGTFADRKSKGSFSSNIQIMGSVEMGIKNKIGDNLYIYSGLYFDYGLTNFAKKNKTFIEYNADAPRDIHNNSILSSELIDSNKNKISLIDKVHPIAFGVKVNVAFEL